MFAKREMIFKGAPSNRLMCDFAHSLFQVVDVSKRISDVPEWFKGSRLNYAENLLKHKDQDKVALYAASKSRPISELPKFITQLSFSILWSK